MQTRRAAIVAAMLLALTAGPLAAWSPGTGHEVVTGFGPRAIALADFDGDGLADIATANTIERTVAVVPDPLRGGIAGAIPVDGAPLAIGAGDLDRDGYTDLAVAVGSPDSLVVLFGDGTGGFSPAMLPLADTPNTVLVVDPDGDGRPEVAVGTADGSLLVLEVRARTLREHVRVSIGGVPVAIASVRTRRALDLAVLDGTTGTVAVVDVTRARPRELGRLTLGGVAGDLEAIRSGSTTHLAVTLVERDEVALLRIRPNGSPLEVQRIAIASAPFAAAAADLDGNGLDELLVALRGSGEIGILDTSAGRLAIANRLPAGICPSAIAASRIDPDVLPDLAVTQPCTNSVVVLPGN